MEEEDEEEKRGRVEGFSREPKLDSWEEKKLYFQLNFKNVITKNTSEVRAWKVERFSMGSSWDVGRTGVSEGSKVSVLL